jgi:hypothetical protein
MRLSEPAAAGLDPPRITPPPLSEEQPERLYQREKKWARMDWQREHSVLARVPRCRVKNRATTVQAVWSADGGSGVVGCITCGARHCAGCGPKIAVDHLRTVERVIAAARDRDYALGFVTLTVPHHAGESLDAVLDRLFAVWLAVCKGAAWDRLRERNGVRGYIRVVETKYGRHGWHPHFHVLFLLAPGAGTADARIADFGAALRRRWVAVAARQGVEASPDAQDARVVQDGDAERLASYLTKENGDGIAEELTLGAWKKSGESATPDQLVDLGMRGDREAVARWNEYELAQQGRRFWATSRRLFEHLEIEEDQSEEEAAQDSGAGAAKSIDFVGRSWYRLARTPGFRGEFFGRLAAEEEAHVVTWARQEGGLCWPSERQEDAA